MSGLVKNMKLHNFIVLFFCAVVSMAARAETACHTQASPANGYTIEATFNKLQKKHPGIQLPQAPTAKLNRWCNQTYKQVEGRLLAMDIFARADQAGVAPALLLVHGGGWRAGSRDLYHTLAARLAEKGYVVATASYRLAGEAKYPAAVYDIRDAVRWLRLNAEKYGLDPKRLALGGGSAGGQIASLVGLTSGHSELDQYSAHNPELGQVSAIVNIDGLSSFTVPLALKHENDPRKKPSSAEAWFGGRYEELPAIWVQASPLSYASEQSPPMLFINSSRPRFSAGQSEVIQRLKHSQVQALQGAPHSFWLFEPWLTPTVDFIDRFLRK